MSISHILFPDIYRAYFKSKRQHLLPVNLLSQIEAQKELLQTFAFVLPKTAYGREIIPNINEINEINAFNNLPLVIYEEIHPYIERALKNEANVLWVGNVKWFSKSSGTTNAKSKYIPVTKDSIEENHFAAGKDLLGTYLINNPNSKLGFGSVAFISGSLQDTHPVSKSKAGDISWIIEQNTPFWINLIKAMPKKILKIPDWSKRLQKATDYLHDIDIKAITGVVSWVSVLMYESVKKYNKQNVLDIWPDLEVFFHGGVSLLPYKKDLEKLIPSKDFYYINVYNASEGFFAFQDTLHGENGMLLLCNHGIYYEFYDYETKKLYSIEEAIIDNNYELVITTLSGLWRYRTGDVVNIVNQDPIRINVTGRTKSVLNIVGEELMVGNVDMAIYDLKHKYNFNIYEYIGTIAEKYSDTYSNRHEWVIEANIDEKEINNFIQIFDKLLKDYNSDYEAKRSDDILLALPIVHIVALGTFNSWLESKNKIGGQNKIPRLCESRDIIEELLKINTTL
jgi:phenylacetate-coenzyme A ligase PaaK-like adenylate-forming protein